MFILYRYTRKKKINVE